MDTNINQPETTLDIDSILEMRVESKDTPSAPATFAGKVNDSFDKQLEILRNDTYKTAIEPKSWFNEKKSVLVIKPTGRVLKSFPNGIHCDSVEKAINLLEVFANWENDSKTKPHVESIRDSWNNDSRITNKVTDDSQEVK